MWRKFWEMNPEPKTNTLSCTHTCISPEKNMPDCRLLQQQIKHSMIQEILIQSWSRLSKRNTPSELVKKAAKDSILHIFALSIL